MPLDMPSIRSALAISGLVFMVLVKRGFEQACAFIAQAL
jgi:hypothetical protein